MFFNGFNFSSREFIQAVNNFITEIVKGINDLFNDILIREILVAGKTN